MAFHGQSVLSCVWGITHAAGAQESPTVPAQASEQSVSRGPARVGLLTLVMRKLRGLNDAAGKANPR
jgi:hypothetical protein